MSRRTVEISIDTVMIYEAMLCNVTVAERNGVDSMLIRASRSDAATVSRRIQAVTGFLTMHGYEHPFYRVTVTDRKAK